MMKQTIQIRKAVIEDIKELQQLSRQTFIETRFASANTEEDMQSYLSENFNSEKLQTELANPKSGFYFAILEGNVVGYLKINTGEVQTELRDSQGLEIERIYVLRAHQGKQIGQHLLDFTLQFARKWKAEYVWLGVWEKNVGAIRFYQKNGFIAFGEHSFFLGSDKQTDIMMKRRIDDEKRIEYSVLILHC